MPAVVANRSGPYSQSLSPYPGRTGTTATTDNETSRATTKTATPMAVTDTDDNKYSSRVNTSRFDMSSSVPPAKTNTANFNTAVEYKIRNTPAEKLSMVYGPFHYKIRAGSFGDVYDEIPWRVMIGLDQYKGRDPIDTSIRNSYCNGVLMNNCYEDRRDRQYIRNHRTPISQYGHMYTTTYGDTIGKKRGYCNKERAFLQTIKAYPLSSSPAYQPELNVDMLRCCVPKPEECLHAEAKDLYHKQLAKQKRFDDVAEPPKQITYNTKDLAKCKHWP